jgi:hypothetical protein
MTTLILTTPQPARHPQPTVKATALAYLMFERSDLALVERFLDDFGLHVVSRDQTKVFARGTAPTPFCYVALKSEHDGFLGLGLQVGNRDDLLKLAALPGASPIERVDWPGGGERVRLVDPSGWSVRWQQGQRFRTPKTIAAQLRRGAPPHQQDAAPTGIAAGRHTAGPRGARSRAVSGDMRLVYAALRVHSK